jgi:DNA-directed RNA polymerase subunit RPC12/RpoP
MQRFFGLGVDSMRPRDESLVAELPTLVQQLLAKLEAQEGLTPHLDLQIAHLKTACQELGLTPASDPPMVPWLLFAAETTVQDDVIRCTYCGSTDVHPKGRTPRMKRYRDKNHQW